MDPIADCASVVPLTVKFMVFVEPLSFSNTPIYICEIYIYMGVIADFASVEPWNFSISPIYICEINTYMGVLPDFCVR